MTSVTAAFTPVMVGNIYHQTTTGTGAHGVLNWFEIVSYNSGTSVVTDRTTNDGTTSVACTGYVGGAGRLNGLEDAFFEMVPAASITYIKNGSYTLSAAVLIASTNSTATNPSFAIGYNTQRGDSCTGSNRPSFSQGSNTWTWGQSQCSMNLIHTSTASSVVTCGINSFHQNCKYTNSSTTASRNGVTSATRTVFVDCEFVSQNGSGVNSASSGFKVLNSYIHDSATGMSQSTVDGFVIGCIFEANTTDAFNGSNGSGNYNVINCTIYGREGKVGNGINISGAGAICRFVNNILYGLTTGITVSAQQNTNAGDANNYFNNTTDVTNFLKTSSALATDPQFAGAVQLTGTTATTSGSVLTDSGADFSTVTDNIDYLHVTGGTGTTLGCYLITSHTSTTLTVNNSLGSGASADKTYFVGTGHNFAVNNAAFKGTGLPTFANSGSESTGSPTPGALVPNSASTVICICD